MSISNHKKIKINGQEFGGYSTYDVMNSLTYSTSPERTLGGNIQNLDRIPRFNVVSIFLSYNLMPYSVYKLFVEKTMGLTSNPEFVVEYFDIDSGEVKTGYFYLAPATQKEVFYKRGQVEGIRNFTIELISTNNEYYGE